MFYFCEAFLADQLPFPDRETLEKVHDEHIRYIAEGVGKGLVVFGGPKTANGGAILIKAPSLAEVEAFLDGDPMIKAKAQHYDITEFRIIEHNPWLDPLLD